ncbi:MAG: hypothetical protein ACR2RE_24530, partial [Geminicoccaceae bacterium]
MTEDQYGGLEEDQSADWRLETNERDAFADTSEGPSLEKVIADVSRALEAEQRPDGHWCYELEADVTIPAEYVLLGHFLDEIDQAIDEKIAVYLRSRQADHGGWPLYE